MNIPDIEHLRQLIETTLSDLGLAGTNWSCVTALTQGRHHPEVSRNGILVVWLPDRHSLEFYADNGGLLRCVSLPQEADRGKAA